MATSARSRRFRFSPGFDRLDMRIAPTGGNPMDPTVIDVEPPPPPANPMDPRLIEPVSEPESPTYVSSYSN